MNINVNTRTDDYLPENNACAYIPRMDIGSRLDEAMKLAKYKTQNDLALASGVPQPTIARILKGGGKRGPETATLKKLAGACGVTFSWLNGETPDTPIQNAPLKIQEKTSNAASAQAIISLIYVTNEELEHLTNLRETDEKHAKMVFVMAKNAPKDKKKIKGIRKLTTT